VGGRSSSAFYGSDGHTDTVGDLGVVKHKLRCLQTSSKPARVSHSTQTTAEHQQQQMRPQCSVAHRSGVPMSTLLPTPPTTLRTTAAAATFTHSDDLMFLKSNNPQQHQVVKTSRLTSWDQCSRLSITLGQLHTWRIAFTQADTWRRGELSVRQVWLWFCRAQPNFTLSQLQRILKDADLEGQVKFNWWEFMALTVLMTMNIVEPRVFVQYCLQKTYRYSTDVNEGNNEKEKEEEEEKEKGQHTTALVQPHIPLLRAIRHTTSSSLYCA
jgi:hypothetical protein